jgi:hypothetical protein
MPGLALPPGMAAPGAVPAAKAAAGDDSADGLMELLSAAEELRRWGGREMAGQMRCWLGSQAGGLFGKQHRACV